MIVRTSRWSLKWAGGLAALLVSLGCGETETGPSNTDVDSSDQGKPVECQAPPPDDDNQWTPVEGAVSPLGLTVPNESPVFDGRDLLIHHPSYLVTLQDQDWFFQETNGSPRSSAHHQATSEHVFLQGGPDPNTNDPKWVRTLSVLDRGDLTYRFYEPPEEVPSTIFSGAVVTDTGAYMLFGGSREVGDMTAFFSEAVEFDPHTEEWRILENLKHPPVELPSKDVLLGTNGVWTSRGLVLLGVYSEQSTMFAYLLRKEDAVWEEIPLENGPTARYHFDLVADDDTFYVVGGSTLPEYEKEYQIWEYSLARAQWTELEVPGWVQPRTGAILGGHLYAFGDCRSAAAYDLELRSWEILPDVTRESEDWVATTPVVIDGAVALPMYRTSHSTDRSTYIFTPRE